MINNNLCRITFFLIIFMLAIISNVFTQESITIHTPNGTPVPALINLPPLEQWQIDYSYTWISENYPNATILSPASNQYYCHGYAWHTSDTGQEVVIGNSGAAIY